MAVTLRQVAQRAKVSPVVVSRVLHNKALAIQVTEATAERVRCAAAELGYRKNVTAVNFRERKTHSIGIVQGIAAPEIPRLEGRTGYFGALLDGIIEAGFREGYSIGLCPQLMGVTPEEAIDDGRFDGLVLYNLAYSSENRAMILGSSKPLVLIHVFASDLDCDTPAVICDNRQGIGLAVDHLTGLGHKRLAYIKHPTYENIESKIRHDSFLEHAHNAGLDAGETDTYEFDGLEKMLTGGYTAVVCDEDMLASHVLTKAEELGIRVPDDVSVIGFDSTSFCDKTRPRLTAVHQPLQKLGETAVELLVQSIRGVPVRERQVVIPCSLDIRDSTAPL